MDKQRRKFLKIAGASVVAGIGAPAFIKLSATPVLASGDGHAAPAAGHADRGGGTTSGRGGIPGADVAGRRRPG